MFSSDPSAQSFSPLQKRPLSTQSWFPQASWPSGQRGSSVKRMGLAFRSLFVDLQLWTASFQSQVCLSISKYSPAGHLRAWIPELVHWITSRQLSPSPVWSRNHSPASLSLQNSSFTLSFLSSCRFHRLKTVPSEIVSLKTSCFFLFVQNL